MDQGGADAGTARVEVSYVSTPEILDREAAALLAEARERPGRLHPLIVRRLVRVLTLYVAVPALCALSGPPRLVWVVAVTAFVAFVAGTVIAVREHDAEEERGMREYTAMGCPAGTLVRAVYTPASFRFVLPWAEVELDPARLTAATARPGVLLLHADDRGPWVVPHELLGDDGTALVRHVLGDRFLA